MRNILCLPDYGNADVISFRSCIHKVGKFKDAVDIAFANSKLAYEVSHALQSKISVSSLEWFEDGVNCEVLRLGGESWEKGKLKITINVEFCPEQPVIKPKTLSNQIEVSQPELLLDGNRRITAQNGQQENS